MYKLTENNDGAPYGLAMLSILSKKHWRESCKAASLNKGRRSSLGWHPMINATVERTAPMRHILCFISIGIQLFKARNYYAPGTRRPSAKLPHIDTPSERLHQPSPCAKGRFRAPERRIPLFDAQNGPYGAAIWRNDL